MRNVVVALALLTAAPVFGAEPETIPLTEVEAARLDTLKARMDTIRVQGEGLKAAAQAIQADIEALAQRAAKAMKVDLGKYRLDPQRGVFMKPSTTTTSSSSSSTTTSTTVP